MRRSVLLAALLAALPLLAACGSDGAGSGQTEALRQLGAQLAASLPRGLPSGAPRPTAEQIIAAARPTREQIDGSPRELIFVALRSRGLGATLAQFGRNAGVTTYTTADGTTLSLADGVLVASRGLGEDLMSARVPSAAAIARGSGSHEREYYFLGGLDQKRVLRISCTLSSPGPGRTEIVGLAYSGRQVVETCAGPTGTITNTYLVEADGRIRSSRQWLSPSVGYADLELLSR
jgi:hypothetical protein